MQQRIPWWIWLVALGLSAVLVVVGLRSHRHHPAPVPPSTPAASTTPVGGEQPVAGETPPSPDAHNTLQFAIPTPKMPALNAHDDFLQAHGKLIDEQGLARAYTDTDNKQVTLTAREALLKENAPALALLRQALTHAYQCPPIRSVAQKMPYFTHFRSLLHLLMLDEQVNAARGNWSAAMQDALQAIALGEKVQHGAVMVGYLSGSSFQMVGIHACWTIIPHLDRRQTHAALQTLQSILAEQTPVAGALREEKWMMLATVKTMLETGGGEGMDQPSDTEEIKRLPKEKKQQLLNECTSYLDAWITNAGKRYPAISEVPPPADPTVRQFIQQNMWKQYVLKSTVNQAHLRMLLLGIALQAYKLDHGSVPARLTALTPSYLPTLPDDPFTLQDTFHYRPQGATYLLYSLGPDGKDDNGKAISNDNPSVPYHRVSEDSQGDLLGGE